MSEYGIAALEAMDSIEAESGDLVNIVIGASARCLSDPEAGRAFLEHIAPHVHAILQAMERWKEAAEGEMPPRFRFLASCPTCREDRKAGEGA